MSFRSNTSAVQYAPSTMKIQTANSKVLATSTAGQGKSPYVGSVQRMVSDQTVYGAQLMRTLGPSQSIRTYRANTPISTASLKGAVNSSSARAPNSSNSVLPVRQAKVLGGGIYSKTDEDPKIKIEANIEDTDTNSDPQFSPEESSLEGTNSDADSDKNVEVREELRGAEIEVKDKPCGEEEPQSEPDTNTEVKEEMRDADVTARPEVSEQTVQASDSEPIPEIDKIDWDVLKQDAQESKPRTQYCALSQCTTM